MELAFQSTDPFASGYIAPPDDAFAPPPSGWRRHDTNFQLLVYYDPPTVDHVRMILILPWREADPPSGSNILPQGTRNIGLLWRLLLLLLLPMLMPQKRMMLSVGIQSLIFGSILFARPSFMFPDGRPSKGPWFCHSVAFIARIRLSWWSAQHID